jgi:hypothetical protein
MKAQLNHLRTKVPPKVKFINSQDSSSFEKSEPINLSTTNIIIPVSNSEELGEKRNPILKVKQGGTYTPASLSQKMVPSKPSVRST